MNRRDPLVQALLTCALVIAAGLVAIALGKRVVARTEDVYDQMPALVSGGIGGIALVVIGCIFAYVQVSRRCAERARDGMTAVLADLGDLSEVRRERAASIRLQLAAAAAVPAPRTRSRKATS